MLENLTKCPVARKSRFVDMQTAPWQARRCIHQQTCVCIVKTCGVYGCMNFQSVCVSYRCVTDCCKYKDHREASLILKTRPGIFRCHWSHGQQFGGRIHMCITICIQSQHSKYPQYIYIHTHIYIHTTYLRMCAYKAFLKKQPTNLAYICKLLIASVLHTPAYNSSTVTENYEARWFV